MNYLVDKKTNERIGIIMGTMEVNGKLCWIVKKDVYENPLDKFLEIEISDESYIIDRSVK